MLKAINTWFSKETKTDVFHSEADVMSSITDSINLEQHLTEQFESLRQPVYQYLMSVFGNAEDAEDLTQDAFLQLYKTVKGGTTVNNVRFWIFRTVHNLAINRKKHNQFIAPLDADSWAEIERLMPDMNPNPEQSILLQEKYERLYLGLKRLSMQERQALYLRAEGFRYREIGEIMNIATKTVAEFLRRGIKKLSEQNGD